MSFSQSGYDPDTNADDEEEKRRLITQVLELQNTLDGWSHFILNFLHDVFEIELNKNRFV